MNLLPSGEFLENGCVRWQVSYSGWQLLLAECGQLAAQLTAGAVRAATVARVGLAARIIAAVSASCPETGRRLEQLSQQLFVIVHKAKHRSRILVKHCYSLWSKHYIRTNEKLERVPVPIFTLKILF